MPSIVKPLSAAVDINAAASNVSSANLVSVTNMNTTPVLVTNIQTGFGVYISPNATVYIEKETTETISAPAANTNEVWATSIAYRA